MSSSGGVQESAIHKHLLYDKAPDVVRICENCGNWGANDHIQFVETPITPASVLVCSANNGACNRAQTKNRRAAIRAATGDGSDSIDKIGTAMSASSRVTRIASAAIGLDSSTPASAPVDSMPSLITSDSGGGNAYYNSARFDIAKRIGIITIDNRKTHMHEFPLRSVYELTEQYPKSLGQLQRIIDAAGAKSARLIDFAEGKDVLGEYISAPKAGKDAFFGSILKQMLSRRFSMVGAVVFVSQAEMRQVVVPTASECIKWLKQRIANTPLIAIPTLTAARTVDPLTVATMDGATMYKLRVNGTDDIGLLELAKVDEQDAESASSSLQWYAVRDVYASAAGFIVVYDSDSKK